MTQGERRDAPTLSFWTASQTPQRVIIPVPQLHRDFDRLFFFFSNPRCTLSTHVDPYLPRYIVVLYMSYMGGGIYIYIYMNVGMGKPFWDRNVELSKVSQTFREWISTDP